ncbi:hypothetical protein U3516DRAFT_744092 [Neocallimastix sp. 'constans']
MNEYYCNLPYFNILKFNLKIKIFQKYISQNRILPIPHFEIHNYQNENDNLNELENKSIIIDVKNIAEKRIKSRENEILQYHLFKINELNEKIRHMEINNNSK